MKNKKLRIGIDLDDVVFDFIGLLLKKYKEKFGREILFEEVSDFYFAKIFGMTEEEFNEFFIEIFDKETTTNMDLIEDANLIVEFAKHNKIFFITSRVDAREGTLESLNKNFSNISFELFFSSNPYCNTEGKNKGEICEDLKIDFMIEDDSMHAKDCAERGIKVFLLDKPWNKNCLVHENVIKVKNWKEILERLKNKDVVSKVKKFVKNECEKHDLGKEIYENHFVYVVNYSKQLAKKLGIDSEIVEIAAWLHDIGSIIYGRDNHHITGAEIAEKKLKEFNYPEEKIQKIKNCILNHRGSVKNDLLTFEEKVLVEADSLTFFDSLEGYILWVIEGDGIKNQKLIKESIKQKAQNKWNQLSHEAKDLVKLKYEAVMLLFDDGN